MENPNFLWGHNRRYNAYTQYFKKLFNTRVQKISVDAGFSCPNRDDDRTSGGCTYCNNNAFNPSYCNPSKPIEQQIIEGIEFHKVRYRRAKNYLVYFQPYSNTFASLNHLKILFENALKQPGVIGLVIGTRPDCIDDEKLKYLKQLSRDYYIIIEYGVESIYNNTLTRINRGHTFEQSIDALWKTADYGINTGAHFIFGLPEESREMMMSSVHEISKLPLTTIKFHQLQIIKDTEMEIDFNTNPSDYSLFSFEDYVDFIVEFTEKLNPNFIIERFAGEVPPRFLAGQYWGHIRNDQINIVIEEELKKRDSWQGKYFTS